MLAATTLVDSLLLDLAMLVAKVDHLAIPVVLGIELDRSGSYSRPGSPGLPSPSGSLFVILLGRNNGCRTGILSGFFKILGSGKIPGLPGTNTGGS